MFYIYKNNVKTFVNKLTASIIKNNSSIVKKQ
jgi:hypothetical protein